MTAATLAAIRAIVAVHATYNRDHLLAHLDAAIERERGTMGGQVKTAPEGGAVTPSIPEGLAINELDWSSDD